MNIPMKYEDVVAKLDAAPGRETALREELALIITSFDELASCVGFSEARLEQTGDSPMDCANQLQQRLTVAEHDAALSAARLKLEEATVTMAIEHSCELQERVAVAEQRAVKFEGLLLQTNELLYQIQGDPGSVPSSSIDAVRGDVFTALKPAEEGEGS